MDSSRNYNLYIIFTTLYETKNMTRAAKLLNLSSHANISKGIRQLEYELDFKLFTTDTKGVTPTNEADKLYEIVKPLFDELNYVEKSIRRIPFSHKVKAKQHPIKLHLVTTGGYMDSEQSQTEGRIVPLKTSITADYLKKYVNPNIDLVESYVALKDSRQLNTTDLKKIVETVTQSSNENILITHGLDTIERTASLIVNSLPPNNTKKIILVGSFYPIKGSTLTDATFNLGFAIASFSSVKAGVYISIQCEVFKPSEFYVE